MHRPVALLGTLRRRNLLALGLAVALVTAPASFQATAGSASACPDPAGCLVLGPDDPVRIGTFVIAYGLPGLGKESARAVELAIELRGGTVAGHPVRLVHLADGCDSGLATTTAEAIAGDKSLVAVIGTTCSGAAFPVAPILGGAGITMISPSNTNALLTEPATRDPFYFRMAYNDGLKAEALADFLIAAEHASAAIVVQEGFQAVADHFADRFTSGGGEVTQQLTVLDSQHDFSTELTTIGSNSPDVLFFYLFSNTAEFVSQTRDTAELADTQLAATDDSVSRELLDQLGDPADAEGMVFSAPDFSFLDEEPYLTTLLHEYLLRFGDVNNPEKTRPDFPYHAYAFDATNRLLDVIQTFQKGGAQKVVIPRTALRDAFAATSDYPGVIGSITCDPNGDCNPQEFVIRVVQDGQFVQVSP